MFDEANLYGRFALYFDCIEALTRRREKKFINQCAAAVYIVIIIIILIDAN